MRSDRPLDDVQRATVGAITKCDPDEDVFADVYEGHWTRLEGEPGNGRALKWMMLAPIAALLLFVVLHLAYSVIAAAVVGGGGM